MRKETNTWEQKEIRGEPGDGVLYPVRRSELRGDNTDASNRQQAFTTVDAAKDRKNGSNRANGGTDLAPEAPKEFTTRITKKVEKAPLLSTDPMDEPLKGRESLVQRDPMIKSHDWRSRGYKSTLDKPYKHKNANHQQTAEKKKVPTVE
jgi:hypothetical protein